MTTYYRVEIQENKGLVYGQVRNPRSCAGKRSYAAAVVATATVRTVEYEAGRLMEAETTIVRQTALLASLTARMGLTVDEATAQHEAAQKAWWGVLHKYEDKVREGRVGMARALTDADRQRAKDLAAVDGHHDPYLPGTAHDIVEAQYRLKNAQRTAEHVRGQNIKAGDQMVVRWSKDPSNAQSFVGTAEAGWLRERGYTLEVRTDLTVSDKKR